MHCLIWNLLNCKRASSKPSSSSWLFESCVVPANSSGCPSVAAAGPAHHTWLSTVGFEDHAKLKTSKTFEGGSCFCSHSGQAEALNTWMLACVCTSRHQHCSDHDLCHFAIFLPDRTYSARGQADRYQMSLLLRDGA